MPLPETVQPTEYLTVVSGVTVLVPVGFIAPVNSEQFVVSPALVYLQLAEQESEPPP